MCAASVARACASAYRIGGVTRERACGCTRNSKDVPRCTDDVSDDRVVGRSISFSLSLSPRTLSLFLWQQQPGGPRRQTCKQARVLAFWRHARDFATCDVDRRTSSIIKRSTKKPHTQTARPLGFWRGACSGVRASRFPERERDRRLCGCSRVRAAAASPREGQTRMHRTSTSAARVCISSIMHINSNLSILE